MKRYLKTKATSLFYLGAISLGARRRKTKRKNRFCATLTFVKSFLSSEALLFRRAFLFCFFLKLAMKKRQVLLGAQPQPIFFSFFCAQHQTYYGSTSLRVRMKSKKKKFRQEEPKAKTVVEMAAVLFRSSRLPSGRSFGICSGCSSGDDSGASILRAAFPRPFHQYFFFIHNSFRLYYSINLFVGAVSAIRNGRWKLHFKLGVQIGCSAWGHNTLKIKLWKTNQQPLLLLLLFLLLLLLLFIVVFFLTEIFVGNTLQNRK